MTSRTVALPSVADRPLVDSALDFPTVYDRWFNAVCGWARGLGGLEADVEDVAQEVFLVVRRKLAAFDGANLPGWLYRITSKTVSDQRRRAWFRRVLRYPAQLDSEALVDNGPLPDDALERREEQQILWTMLGRLSEKRRIVLVLYEIEGYSGPEISALLDIPLPTVWTRLHHARKQFLAMCDALNRREAAP